MKPVYKAISLQNLSRFWKYLWRPLGWVFWRCSKTVWIANRQNVQSWLLILFFLINSTNIICCASEHWLWVKKKILIETLNFDFVRFISKIFSRVYYMIHLHRAPVMEVRLRKGCLVFTVWYYLTINFRVSDPSARNT